MKTQTQLVPAVSAAVSVAAIDASRSEASSASATSFRHASTGPRRLARYATHGARVLLGLVFFVFGLDGFLHFFPQPTTPPPADAMAFALALIKTGSMFPLIKGTEVLGGVLLLANRFVPLALVLLAPVIVNIVAFNTLLAPSGAPIAWVILALELGLAWAYRRAYQSLLASRVSIG